MPANLPVPKPSTRQKLEDYLLMKTIKTLLPTATGWILRKTVQYGGTVAAMVSTWLIAHGSSEDQGAAIGTGAAAALLFVVELALSRIAAKLKEQ